MPKGSQLARRCAQHRAGIRAEFATAGPRPPADAFQRQGAQRRGACRRHWTTRPSVPSPCRVSSVTYVQVTCTGYLHTTSVYFVCVDGHSISLKPVESIARPPVLTEAACAEVLCGADGNRRHYAPGSNLGVLRPRIASSSCRAAASVAQKFYQYSAIAGVVPLARMQISTESIDPNYAGTLYRLPAYHLHWKEARSSTRHRRLRHVSGRPTPRRGEQRRAGLDGVRPRPQVSASFASGSDDER